MNLPKNYYPLLLLTAPLNIKKHIYNEKPLE
jgi:hypothetical protein